MGQPTAYDRSALNGDTYFTDYTTASPSAPQLGSKLDQEFVAIELTLSEVLTNLALLQRDDGELANGVVGADQLGDDVYPGMDVLGPWAASTAYTVRDGVVNGTSLYRCTTSHTSSASFATDLAASYWTEIFDFNDIGVPVLIAGAGMQIGTTTAGSSTALELINTYSVDEGYQMLLQEYLQ